MNLSLGDIRYSSDGLVPVIVQEQATGEVLMLAYANVEAVRRTIQTGFAHFYSRSREVLWQKGETSGNRLRVLDIAADCDSDALLYRVSPEGPACHTGAYSCFFRTVHCQREGRGQWDISLLGELHGVLESRKRGDQDSSYVAKLLQSEKQTLLRKIGEEATEVILAYDDPDELVAEVADLLFHCMVLLAKRERDLGDVLCELRSRRKQKGQTRPRPPS